MNANELAGEIGEEWSPERIRARVRELAPWFHNLELRGVQTAPDHFLGDYPRMKWERFARSLPDPRGKSVLDIGCNAGFHSLELKRRGARRVVGIDIDELYLEQARFAAAVECVDIELHQLSVYEVAALEEKFDLVLFLGVLYHLRHPLLALDLLREHVVGEHLVVQSMLRGSTEIGPVAADYPFSEQELFAQPWAPCAYFIEHRLAGDPTNWWIPNRAGLEAMLRNSGFEIMGRPEEEVYICRLAPVPEGSGPVYPHRQDGG